MVSIREASIEDSKYLEEMDRILGGAVWTSDEWKDILNSSFYKVYIAEVDGEIAGFMVVYVGIVEAHLMKLFVRRVFRSKGIGHKFMNKLVDVARRHGKDMIFLEVDVDNIAAVNLYKEHGFRVLKRLRGFYENRKDAYLMLMEIGGIGMGGSIRVALGSEDGKVIIDDHLGEAPYFYLYDVTEDVVAFVEKRINDAPEEKVHGDPRKRKRVQEILKDSDVLLARQVSTSFIKMKDQGKWQPVVVKDVVYIEEGLKLVQKYFGTITDMVKKRRQGNPSGKIVLIQKDKISFI